MHIHENRLVFREAPSSAPSSFAEKAPKSTDIPGEFEKSFKQHGNSVAMDLAKKSVSVNPAEIAKKNGYDKVGEYAKDGLAIAQKDDLFFLVDKNGKKQSSDYFEITELSDGMRWGSGENDHQWILIGEKGKEVNKKMYKDVLPFQEGKAGVKEDKWSFIDKKGNDLGFGKFDEVYSFNNGVAGVRNGPYWKFIKADGSKLNDKTYSRVDDFENGVGYGKRGGVWYKIALSGKEEISTHERAED